MRPLLEDPTASWDGVALTTHGYQNHAVSSERWRYIRYKNGSEELYDHEQDPYEFRNLAADSTYAAIKKELAVHIPESVAQPKSK